MTNDTMGIDDKALSSLSVAPDGNESDAHTPPGRGDAGGDHSIAGRMESDPADSDARLDRGLDESMDASDPPASTQPIHSNGPAPSSGYDPEQEEKLARDGMAD
ncbi:hypothetical protein ASE73_01400 [Sphingomonas sp. Leaf24]|uniref:hypothetical protein n=1 Tax=unclassified Sphingomonas TaxID=196159 RepID=UPI000701BF5D|nr:MULTISPECIES: hypothetical protein [unclassified Sphingomonas]KQM22917.1 hypothetical protein ASE50_01400 [Sphingomonas sp. Leaf5]KQM95775.1 hypothetical protein ASE73_01400 [Sphingomonas sp. Leaf24]